MLIEETGEKPGTFYIEEKLWKPWKIVITRQDGTQHVDYPVQYVDDSFGYDFPERVPAQVKRAMENKFTVEE